MEIFTRWDLIRLVKLADEKGYKVGLELVDGELVFVGGCDADFNLQ